MAEYDTSIRVSTKVDSTELDKVAKTFKDIEGKADDAKEKVEELDKVSSGVKTEDYEKQAKALEKVNTELDKNIRKQKEAVQTNGPDYRSVWTEQEEAHIDALIAKTKEQKELAAEEKKLQSIRINAQVSDQKLIDLLAEQIRLQERLAELKKAGLTAGYQEYDNITARLKQIKEQVDYEQKGFRKMGESGKKALNKINTHAKKSGGLLSV